MSATTTKKANNQSTAPKLNSKVFGVVPQNYELIKSAYVAYLANGRVNLSKTLKRGEVRGGGKKPWRQKGTGRARFGSSRVPIWRGGGITFGPTGNENYSKTISTASARAALRQALSLKAKAGGIKVVESFTTKDGKVKTTLQKLNKLGVSGNVIIVVDLKDKLVERATNNLPNVKAVQADYLNVYEVMNADSIVINQKALALIEDRLSTTKKSPKASQ